MSVVCSPYCSGAKPGREAGALPRPATSVVSSENGAPLRSGPIGFSGPAGPDGWVPGGATRALAVARAVARAGDCGAGPGKAGPSWSSDGPFGYAGEPNTPAPACSFADSPACPFGDRPGNAGEPKPPGAFWSSPAVGGYAGEPKRPGPRRSSSDGSDCGSLDSCASHSPASDSPASDSPGSDSRAGKAPTGKAAGRWLGSGRPEFDELPSAPSSSSSAGAGRPYTRACGAADGGGSSAGST